MHSKPYWLAANLKVCDDIWTSCFLSGFSKVQICVGRAWKMNEKVKNCGCPSANPSERSLRAHVRRLEVDLTWLILSAKVRSSAPSVMLSAKTRLIVWWKDSVTPVASSVIGCGLIQIFHFRILWVLCFFQLSFTFLIINLEMGKELYIVILTVKIFATSENYLNLIT